MPHKDVKGKAKQFKQKKNFAVLVALQSQISQVDH
jgi:hypothetical protein